MSYAAGRLTVSKRNEEAIINCIRKHGVITRDEICEFTGLSKHTIDRHIFNLKKAEYPNIKFMHGHVSWIGDSAENIENKEQPDRYPSHKNDEGYNDPTAGANINKMDDIFGEFNPGDVWAVEASNGTIEQYLVIRSFKGCASCLKLYFYSESKEFYNPVHCIPVNFQTKAFVDCRKVVSKPTRYFVEKIFDIPNLKSVRAKISMILGLDSVIERVVEVPVEKIVEKQVEVEVPVEKIVEKIVEKPVPIAMPLESDSVELALVKQKADIYERITWAMLYNNNCAMEE